MERERLLALVEATLDEVLPRPEGRAAALFEAMRYAVGTGGKRIRPLICLASSVAAGGVAEDARYPAAAIEILHNYTLVHDDLPAMDNDVERRGKPTVWKRFGEANAILAGDALLALAYQVAAKSPRNVAEIVGVLGEMGVGVVMGQVGDLQRERGSGNRRRQGYGGQVGEWGTAAAKAMAVESGNGDVEFVYRHKTADLFVAAAKSGALAGGGGAADAARLGDFALNLGLAFQYEDDLLDGDGAYPADETRRLAEESTAAALAALDGLPGDASFLRDLARSLVGRTV